MSLKFTSVPTKILADSITSAASAFRLNNIVGWDGEDLAAADFGSVGYGIFRNATNTIIELFEFDPATIANSTITITRRGLKYDAADLTTEVAANKLSWNRGDTFVDLGTDTPQMLQWLKEYIDAASIAGAVPMTESVQGIAKLSVAAASPTNPIAVGDNDPRMPTTDENNAMAGGGALGAPSATNKFTTDDYFDDTANFVRNTLPLAYMPTTMFFQENFFPAITGVDSNGATEFATCSNSTGTQFYVYATRSGSIYYYERDTVTGTFMYKATVNPAIAHATAGDLPAMVVVGSYVYFFVSNDTNVIGARFDAQTLANEVSLTVPTITATNDVAAWTDGTDIYVVAADSSTTSRRWTISGTTLSAASTATISSPSHFFWQTMWDGTNAYWIVHDGDHNLDIYKLTNINGSTTSLTTYPAIISSDQDIWIGGIPVDTRMYVVRMDAKYDETAQIATRLTFLPITKP